MILFANIFFRVFELMLRSNIHLQFSVFLLFLHSLGIRFILLSKIFFFTWIIPPFFFWSFYLFSVNFMCLILRRMHCNLLLADRQRGGDWSTLDTKFHETPKTLVIKMKVVVAQSCLTLSNTMECSYSGPSVHGIPQARILE